MPTSRSTTPTYIYILRCADASYYTGTTADIRTRLKDHNAGKASLHTSLHRPIILEYLEGPYSLTTARAREAQIKHWSAEKRVSLIRRNKARCDRLRFQIALTGAEAIGGPPDPFSPLSANELSAMLSFIRADLDFDGL